MEKRTGVYPCYENQFEVQTKAATTDPQSEAVMSAIADMESFSVSFDNGVEEWTPFESEGWTRRLMTSKSLTISVSGKRNIGDPGNDYIASMYSKNGRAVETVFSWVFPDGAKVTLNAVINVTNIGAGDSTGVAPLEFDVMSNGKPQFVESV